MKELKSPSHVALKNQRLKTSQLTPRATLVRVAMAKPVRADVAVVVVVAVAAIATVSVVRVQNVALAMAVVVVAKALPQATQGLRKPHLRT